MEKYATNTYHASEKDISGAFYAQIFTILCFYCAHVIGINSESEGPQAFKTFIRQIGALFSTKNDNI